EKIDPDMLDERARFQLDYVHPRDLVRMIPVK
ncbi:septum formation initiator family protein, partial [Herbaspirillum sp. HC18]